MSSTAVVFEKDGNRFLVSGFWWPKEERPASWVIDAMMYAMALGIKHETELLVVDTDERGGLRIPCVHTTMSGPQLMHGSGTVYVISGPLFDECQEDNGRNG